MAEQVVGAELGTKLGDTPRTFPGLAPVAKKLSELQSEVARLEAAKYELDSIRATLLLNFGQLPERYGFTISDQGSTQALMLTVLQTLVQRCIPLGSKPEDK